MNIINTIIYCADGNVYLLGNNIYQVYLKIDNAFSEDDDRNLYAEVHKAMINYREDKNIDAHKNTDFLFVLADEGFIEWTKEKKEYDDLVFERISEKDYDNLRKGTYEISRLTCLGAELVMTESSY